jgi:hypothetical protein
MSEGDVLELLVEHTNLLLVGVGVFFTILSVYLAGLNFVLSNETLFTRSLAFLFVTIALAMLMAVMVGGQLQHAGLIERLVELERSGELTGAGRRFLENSRAQITYPGGVRLSIDDTVLYLAWGSAALCYAALLYLTFAYRWRPEGQTGLKAAAARLN